MSNPDERADQVVPMAAALIAAVADRDQHAVAAVLADVEDWQALAVVLADRASSATGYAFTERVLADLDAGVDPLDVAARYGLSARTIRKLAEQTGRYESEQTLVDGDWVPVRGVLHWVARDPAEHDEAAA